MDTISGSNKTKSNPQAIGEYLYIFEGGVGTTKCMIFGHSGFDPFLKEGQLKFKLPANVILRYAVKHGRPNITHPLQVIDRESEGAYMEYTSEPGASVDNYRMVKGVGRHWKQDDDYYTYSAISNRLAIHNRVNEERNMHYVTIRNRTFPGAKSYMMLEDIIKAVCKDFPDVNEFVMTGCRSANLGVTSKLVYRISKGHFYVNPEEKDATWLSVPPK